MHLLVSIDPENCKYCIFAVIKKELWSCVASRIIFLSEPSATDTRIPGSVESCYFVFVVKYDNLTVCKLTHRVLPFE